ncbi:MAG: restriction endonuclease subunit S [Nitrosomonas ureae]
MNKLPIGWIQATFADLINEISNGIGGTQNKEGIGIPVSRIETISNERINFLKVGYLENYDSTKLDKYQLRSGDILFSHINSPIHLGKTAIYRTNQILYHGINLLKIRITTSISCPEYFNYFCKHTRLKGEFALRAQHAVNQSSLNQTKLRQFAIPLPPINEQKRIADKLDSILTRVDACRERLDRIPAILKRFRQSVLAAATSGKLTEEWRNEVGSDKLWQTVRLEEIAHIQGGITKDAKKQSTSDDEMPYLRVANVQRGYLDLNDIKTIRVPSTKLKTLLLESGDILFNEGGDIDKLGRGWIWEGQIPRCTFQNHVFRARLLDKQNQPKYISWWSNYRGLNYFLRSGKQTTNLASINKSMLSALPIDLPPSNEQTEIVRRVEELFAYAGRIEARYAATRAKADKLTPAILAKAFRGELVPQDPNDEPASVLLERIQKTLPATKQRRRSKTNPAAAS